MNHPSVAAGILVVLLLAPSAPRAAPPEVVVSLKPIHSIVAAVMTGIATPRLVIEGGASPHGYALRPSAAVALARADLVFWVGEELELFLARPIAALAGAAEVVTLGDLPGLANVPRGEAGGFDPHIWLDPANARLISHAAADALTAADPANRARYESNAAAFADRLDILDGELRATLAPVVGLPYVVFHDAYGHFERHYGLAAIAAVTVNPQNKPGAKRITEIRQSMAALGVRCLFAEPQFAPALAKTIIEGTGARLAVLDPLGANLETGPEAYFAIMRGLAASLRDCLCAP